MINTSRLIPHDLSEIKNTTYHVSTVVHNLQGIYLARAAPFNLHSPYKIVYKIIYFEISLKLSLLVAITQCESVRYDTAVISLDLARF